MLMGRLRVAGCGGGGSATLWLPALLLLLLVTVGVLVGTFALFYHEYSEEIERLKRDLLDAQEKSGALPANHERMTADFRTDDDVLAEKLERIRAAEEEAAVRREACQQLQQLYDEQQAVLHATAEELNVTKANLSLTRSKLKQNRRQRDDNGHVVSHQAHGARDLLKTADPDHARKSKLDRKRSIEKENERINHEFRQSFAQNIGRMEDSLTRFVQDHTKFLGDLSANYGNVLAKQSRDLSALSELMAALVKSQSQFADGLRKTATDGTHGTQEFFKQFLATTRAHANTQVATLQHFLTDSFLPKFQTVAKALQEQGQAVQQLQRAMTEELQQQADLVNVLLTEQKDGMNRLRQVAQQWDVQTETQLRRISEQQTLSSQALSEFDAESNKQMQMIINLVNSVQQTRENFKSRLNDTSTEISNAVQKAQEERSNFYHTVETTANEYVTKGKELRSQLETARSVLLQTATVSLEKSIGRMQDTAKTCAVIEGDASSHVSASQGAWQELFSAQETDLRKHSDHLNSVLLNHAHLATESLQSLHTAAHTQEALLEEQRSDMITLVRERQDDLEAHTTSLSDWALLLGTEVKQRNEDVVKFLVEDLRQDATAGQAALQHREFYPRFTAPSHDRLLDRLREERYQAEEFDHEQELSMLSRRHATTGAHHVPPASETVEHGTQREDGKAVAAPSVTPTPSNSLDGPLNSSVPHNPPVTATVKKSSRQHSRKAPHALNAKTQ